MDELLVCEGKRLANSSSISKNDNKIKKFKKYNIEKEINRKIKRVPIILEESNKMN